MEARRLIKFGRGSFVISIPKKWIISHNLKKGDLIFLDDSADKLIVSPYLNKGNLQKKVTLRADNKEFSQLSLEIISAYLNNVVRIEIVGNVDTLTGQLRELLSILPGLEILEQKENGVVIHDLIDRAEVAIEPIFRRVDMIIRSMLGDAHRGLDVEENDKQVNRLTFLTKRVLRCAIENPSVLNSLNLNNLSLLKHWLMIGFLESIGDEVKRISRLIREEPPKTSTMDALKLLEESYTSIMRAYHTGDISKARQIQIQTKQRSEQHQLLIEKKGANPQLVYHLKALNAHLKNMSRTCIDFTKLPPAQTKETLITPLERTTGFLSSA